MNNTSFENLIERISVSNSHGLEVLISEYLLKFEIIKKSDKCRFEKYDEIDTVYEFLRGIVWGLYGTGFISENERDTLVNELIYKTRLF